MATEVKLPRVSQGMDEGKILRWLKNVGDPIEKGDELYEVETEKVTVEVEAPAGGTLLRIDAPDDTTVPIGTVIAWLGEQGESLPEPSNGSSGGVASGASSSSASTKEFDAGSSGSTSASGAAVGESLKSGRGGAVSFDGIPVVTSGAVGGSGAGDGRVKASPLARSIARKEGIDLAALHGSGPDGRIIARDLSGAGAAAAAHSRGADADLAARGTGWAATDMHALPTTQSVALEAYGGGDSDEYEVIPLTSMRRTIASRLSEAWAAPAFYLDVAVDMTSANSLRKKLVETNAKSIEAGSMAKPTVSDIITKACAVALRENPDMNVLWNGDSIVRVSGAHIGMAVATEAGLLVPVIKNAHAKTIMEIAADRADVVTRARDNKIKPADLEGGTFTVSNLGMMGIDSFTAVLNPPMAGILAVGRTADTPVAKNGRVEVRPMMSVTLGCDHRSVDGAVGARFLAAFKLHIEDPLTML